MRRPLIAAILVLVLTNAASAGPVVINVQDKKSGQPIPCRIHLKDAAGKPKFAPKLPFWFDHFVCPGTAKLVLDPGKYTIEIERGPEFSRVASTFAVADEREVALSYQLDRMVDLAADGWWCGDLHVHRPVEVMELLMRAEDLHVAPVITWWSKQNLWTKKDIPADPLVRFDGNRYYHVMAGEDEREGGALLYFNLKKPLNIVSPSKEFPSPMKFVEEARLAADDVWIDIEKPFWWDVALWLTTGKMNSIGIANNHMCRDRMYETEAWGRPRLAERLPAPLGNGYWTQEIYYHVLNAGLRIPPSAGSASGVLPNPVGHNRVYVHVGKELTYAKWWEGLRAGRSFVTNGPLFRVHADGKLPGHVFKADEGTELKIDLTASIFSNDPLRFIEVVVNGQIAKRIPIADVNKANSLGAITFKESGWFLVRTVADNKKTFRFASTAPYYVEVGPKTQRISKASAEFFLEWSRERMARIKLDDAGQRKEVLAHHLRAERFWRDRVAQANAD